MVEAGGSSKQQVVTPVAFLVAVAVLVTLQLLIPAGQRGWVILGALIASIVCILAGVVLHRPRARSFWLLVAGSLVVWAVGTVMRVSGMGVIGPWDPLFLAGYGMLIAAAGALGKRAWTKIDSYVDVAIVATTLGMAAAAIWIEPSLREADLTPLESVVLLGYPILSLLLFGAMLTCAFGPMQRSVSMTAVLVAFASIAVGGSLLPTTVLETAHPAENLSGLPWTIGYIALAVAALDPSMRTMFVRDASSATHSRMRLTALAGSLIIVPVFLLIALLAGVRVQVLVIAAFGLPLAALIAARVAMLIRESEGRTQAFAEREGLLVQAEQIANLGSWSWHITEDVVRWSDQLFRIFGIAPQNFGATLQSFLDLVHPDDRQRVQDEVSTALTAGSFVYSCRIVRPSGEERVVDCRGQTVYAEGEPVSMYGIVLDVTDSFHESVERKQLEEQLRQSQKMEAVGRLAGGIAHDFNNLLTAILGHAGLLLGRDDLPREVRGDIQEIEDAAGAGRDITGALLDIGQRRLLEQEELDLNEVVLSFRPVLSRLLGEDITLEVQLGPAPLFVHADQGRLEQVLLNLVVNAREAMPTGGTLTVRTEEPGKVPPRSRPLGQRRWALLSVSDTGVGIDPSHLQRVFEPFFSTKEGTQGRGLGLSIVYGIVSESNGFIDVVPRDGRGTEMRIFLPLAEGAPRQHPPVEVPEPDPGPAVVLVVEDEPQVRATTQRVLSARGYAVLTAADGVEALEIASADMAIDLLLTDVVMPEMNGVALAEHFLQLQPRAQVIYMSGYTADVLTTSGLAGTTIDFVAKPFRPDELVTKVRQVLGRTRESRP